MGSSFASAIVDHEGQFKAGAPDTEDLSVVSTYIPDPIETSFSLMSTKERDYRGGEDFTIDPADPLLMAACGDGHQDILAAKSMENHS
ncbi:MAG: hypothetical protein WCL28_05700 [bacterium]